MTAQNLFIIDLASTTVTDEDVRLLLHPLVAGVILFSRNFADREQLQDLVQTLRRRVAKPLLITVDQEGGRVQRFREGFTQLPAMQAFSLLPENEQQYWAKEAGWQMAMEILALDIDLSFAPVLDLGHDCLAIGDRSFSCDRQKVIALGESFIAGMHEAGMAATGKHFPGHGAVIADSHKETPIDDRSKQRIFAEDIRSFADLIRKNALQAIMPAHVIYPACDSLPASGSPYWLQTILRSELQFNGAIFSDDLGMQGAAYLGNYAERCQASFKAGCDLLLLCNNRPAVESVFEAFHVEEDPAQSALRQQRLNALYKRRSVTFEELENSARYQQNKQFLGELQRRWQQQKTKTLIDPTEKL